MGLIAGILLVLISIAHNIYGEVKQVPSMKKLTNDSIAIGSQRIMIFQGGFLLLAAGIIQILISIGLIELTGISKYFPIGIVLLNFSTALLITVLFHREIFKITIPQFLIFTIILVFQIFSL